MSCLLADTSGKGLSAVIYDDNSSVVASISIKLENRLSERMLSAMDFLFKSSGLEPADIDDYYIVTGPGSFTGIRIGVGTLLGFCMSAGKELRGISSLDAAALVSGKKVVKTAVKLRGRVYGYRHYDFEKDDYSEYFTGKIENLEEYYIINSGGEWFDLSKALASDKFELFVRDYSPMYMRPSEAEINFDKKSSFC